MKKLLIFLITVWLVACVPAQPTQTVPLEKTNPPIPKLTHPNPTDTAITIPTSAPLPGASVHPPAALRQVSQLKENINGIVLSGDVAYVGLDQTVAAIDISQHENPWAISQSESLPGDVALLLLIPGEPDPFLLVNADRYLVILDISNQNMFTPIQQVELTGSLTAMIFDPQSNILYAGGRVEKNTGFISAIEITSQRQMNIIESIEMPEFPLSLGLAEGSLFAGAEGYQGGLYHIQLPAPGELTQANLVIESTPVNPLQPFSLQVVGGRLYVSYKAIEAYDISDPDQPQQVWRTAGHVVREFRVVGDQIYWFGWTIKSENMYEVINAPESISGSPVGLIAGCTAMHDRAFLIAYEGFEIYETIEP
jgi:hypothetical protein